MARIQFRGIGSSKRMLPVRNGGVVANKINHRVIEASDRVSSHSYDIDCSSNSIIM